QAGVAQRAGVHDRAVADGDVVTDQAGLAAGRVRAVMGDVDDRAILDVAARADADTMHVAANDGARPHRCIVAQVYVADDGGGRVDVYALAEYGSGALPRTDVLHEPDCRLRVF